MFSALKPLLSERPQPKDVPQADVQSHDAALYRNLKQHIERYAFAAAQRAYKDQLPQTVGLGHWGTGWGGYQIAAIFYPPREPPALWPGNSSAAGWPSGKSGYFYLGAEAEKL